MTDRPTDIQDLRIYATSRRIKIGEVRAVQRFTAENLEKQAGAELGQAQPELGFGENVLSLRGCAWGWG